MRSLRVLVIGGLFSFRALFHWLNPWIYIPSLLIAPIFQILLFVYIGRSAGVESDAFFVIGNAVQFSAIPCLFAMGHTITAERFTQTLGIVLSTPTPRIPLFLGRSIPVVFNGWFVAMFSLVVGGRLVGVRIPAAAWLPIALAVLVAAVSCTGLGLVNAALGLRVRDTATLNNIIIGLLLVFCGANVPVGSLPGWMQPVSQWIPLTHAIEAARDIAAGATLRAVAPLLLREIAVGAVFALLGLATLAVLERQSRRSASLEMS
ncbi:MAG TPA: ABC transporter permease [Streptosporangiaceae bacterium]